MYLLKQDKHTDKRIEIRLFIYLHYWAFLHFLPRILCVSVSLYGTIYPNLFPPQTETHTQKNQTKPPMLFSSLILNTDFIVLCRKNIIAHKLK